MTAILQPQFYIEEDLLKEQIEQVGYIKFSIKPMIYRFFRDRGILHARDILLTDLEDLDGYLETLQVPSQIRKKYRNSLYQMRMDARYELYPDLIKEVNEWGAFSAPRRKRALHFLMDEGLQHVSEINYDVRERYESLLKKELNAGHLEYLRVLDVLKQEDNRRQQMKRPFIKPRPGYQKERFFLYYHPDYDLAVSFFGIRDKEEMLFDFSLPAPDNMKRQIFEVLTYILEHVKDRKDRRVRFILPLKWLYQYCVDTNVTDLERLTREQVEELRQRIAQKVVGVSNSMQIVDNCRKILFLHSPDIHWQANIWYLERFALSEDRICPSNPAIRLRFDDIPSEKNEALLRTYMQYKLMVTDKAISTIRSEHYVICRFLNCIDDITQLTKQDMQHYIASLEKEELKEASFNDYLTTIYQFFAFLYVRKNIKSIPFDLSDYLKKEYPSHCERYVPEDIQEQMRANLGLLPEHLRFMYLHLYCIGLRISEVCIIKGNSYYWRHKTAWIKIYQNKMRAEKVVPIPEMLYKLMRSYIKKHGIGPDDYVFPNKDGGAFKYGTFKAGLQEGCSQFGITDQGYVFRSHDYRHTIATKFFDSGVSIQTIRDYLGHRNDDMTKQYIDYAKEKIEEANTAYFKETQHRLCLDDWQRGEKYGPADLLKGTRLLSKGK